MTRRRPPRAHRGAWPLVILPWLVAGCATGVRAPGPSGPEREAARFLVAPATGYPLALDRETALALEGAFESLLGGRVAEAEEVANSILRRNAALHPARVLLAQSDLLARRLDAARERLAPVVAELPGYTAARLALGRTLELLGDIVGSYAAYREVTGSETAERRAAVLRDRALDVLRKRVQDAATRGHVEAATTELGRLEAWDPETPETFEVAAVVARAAGDPRRELMALRGLAGSAPAPRETLERLAALETQVGDPARGIDILERLLKGAGGDPRLEEELRVARFRWRLTLLPDKVREVAGAPELTRGGLASLLYWMFPTVRLGGAGAARIATDILEDPARDEIVRVVNLGLMDIDATLHRFEPQRPVSRLETLLSLLRLLDRSRPRPACLAGSSVIGRSPEAVCGLAVRCGLLESAADCLPLGTVPGGEAVELGRRALDQLGGR